MPFRRFSAIGASLAAVAAAAFAGLDPTAAVFRPTIDPWGGGNAPLLAGIPRFPRDRKATTGRRPDAERKTPEWACSEARKPCYMNAGERRRYLAAKAAGVR